jgi:hypothetical protein
MGGGSTPRPALSTLGKEIRYPLYRRLGGPQSQSGWERKILPQQGFDPRTVQPVASRYTDYAIPDHNFIGYIHTVYTHTHTHNCSYESSYLALEYRVTKIQLANSSYIYKGSVSLK